MKSNRRKFLGHSLSSVAALAGGALLPYDLLGKDLHRTARPQKIALTASPRSQPQESIRFSVIGLNHGHIYGMVDTLQHGGGTLVAVYAREPELLQAFSRRYPQARVAGSETEILEDPSVQLVASAAIPIERAPLGIRVMQSGKDYLTDKPGIVTLKQLKQVKKVQQRTDRIYSILYGERLGSPASVQIEALIAAGAIGRVVQTIGLAPHRMRPESRPDWFFDLEKAGGILCDLGSHHCDQFLAFTNSRRATVNFSQVGNFGTPDHPELQDFGEVSLRSPNATGYIRLDWFTPEGLSTWGDGRTFVLGTEGYMETRKYIDIAGRKGGHHLFLVNQKETIYYDCSGGPVPFGEQLVSDVVNRTETAMTQEHCFLATELALIAQKKAITHL